MVKWSTEWHARHLDASGPRNGSWQCTHCATSRWYRLTLPGAQRVSGSRLDAQATQTAVTNAIPSARGNTDEGWHRINSESPEIQCASDVHQRQQHEHRRDRAVDTLPEPEGFFAVDQRMDLRFDVRLR
jgi:hypothetical protein